METLLSLERGRLCREFGVGDCEGWFPHAVSVSNLPRGFCQENPDRNSAQEGARLFVLRAFRLDKESGRSS